MKNNLTEIQAKRLPRMKWSDVLTGELADDEQIALNAYFSAFVVPQKNAAGTAICVGCGRVMRGGIEGFLLGGAPDSCTMEWGIAHGECFCSNCHWPGRAYHFDIPKDAPIIKRLSVVLQYHPDELSEKAPS